MKSTIFICTLLLTVSIVFSQELTLDSETGKFTNKQLIVVDGFSMEQLYDRAMEWVESVSLDYKSDPDVIQYSDRESGKIVCNGNFIMKTGRIRHTLTLIFREGRYSQAYTDFSYYSSGTEEMAFEEKGAKKKVISEASQKIGQSTESLKKFLRSDNR